MTTPSLSALSGAITQKDLARVSQLAQAMSPGLSNVLALGLAFAARSNRPEVMGELAKHIDVNTRLPAEHQSATALHVAAQSGSKAAVATLLALGANPLIANNAGSLPLHLAIQRSSTAGSRSPAGERLEMAQLLLSAAPDSAKIADSEGSTPLRLAALRASAAPEAFDAHEKMLRLLIPLSDINAKFKRVGTPLIAAARAWNEQGVRLLLEAGADPLLMDGENHTAIARVLGPSVASPPAPQERLECLRLLCAAMDLSKNDLGAQLFRKALAMRPPWPEAVALLADPRVSGDAWRDPQKCFNGKFDALSWMAVPQENSVAAGLLPCVLRARNLFQKSDATPDEQAALARTFDKVWRVAASPQKPSVASPYAQRAAEARSEHLWTSLSLLAPWGSPQTIAMAAQAAREGMKPRQNLSLGHGARDAQRHFLSQAEAIEIQRALSAGSQSQSRESLEALGDPSATPGAGAPPMPIRSPRRV